MRIIGDIQLDVAEGERPRRGQIGYTRDTLGDIALYCRDRGVWTSIQASDRPRPGETARDCACRLTRDAYGRYDVWDLRMI